MAVVSMKRNRFKVVFADSQNKQVDLDYSLNDNLVADKWFKKIKHLKNVAVDPVECNQESFTNLKHIYTQFCEFAGVEPINFIEINQQLLNKFHELYEQTHNTLANKPNNSIIYKFHHAIHFHEGKSPEEKRIDVGWGVKEGMLTEIFHCNHYYENHIQTNNIYLPWTELGKKPLQYWKNKEPDNQNRFNELAKPHITLRPKFMIALKDIKPVEFENNFVHWFSKYKKDWLETYDIKKWDTIDEYSAVALAYADHKQSLQGMKFVKILV
jgi:hypothetical protein